MATRESLIQALRRLWALEMQFNYHALHLDLDSYSLQNSLRTRRIHATIQLLGGKLTPIWPLPDEIAATAEPLQAWARRFADLYAVAAQLCRDLGYPDGAFNMELNRISAVAERKG